MFCRLRLTFTAAALAVSALVPTLASAEAFQYRSSGFGASAGFNSYSECLQSQVGLTVGEGRSSEKPGEKSFAFLILFVFEYDTCTTEEDPVLISASFFHGEIPIDSFSTHGGLHAASLQVTVEAYNEFTGEFDLVTLDVSWTGEGERTHGHSHENQAYPGFRQISHMIGSYRNASVTASALVNGRELMIGPEFFQAGYLRIDKYGLTTVVPSR